MNWVKIFLGLYDQEQAQKTAVVSEHARKSTHRFNMDMNKIQVQAKMVHRTATKAVLEADKLVSIVDDVTAKIAVATGRLTR